MKKTLLILTFTIILALLAYFGYQSYQKIGARKIFTEQKKNLPNTSKFKWLSQLPINYDSKTIILFFNPDCEHCQYEAKSIEKQQSTLQNINLWWVSSADSSSIMQFRKDYGLDKLSNNYFAIISSEEVIKTFGSVSVPHIFIYDKQVLQKEFKGETKVESILKHIK